MQGRKRRRKERRSFIKGASVDAKASTQCPACGSPSSAGDGPCSACGAEATFQAGAVAGVDFSDVPEMRYQDAYVWIVLVSALDIILTLLVVVLWQGHEVNPFAAWVIHEWGFGWAIVCKFALVMLAIVICEVVGRFDDGVGRGLSITAVVISAFPVAYTFALLLWSGQVVQT